MKIEIKPKQKHKVIIKNKQGCEKKSSHACFVFTCKNYFLIDRKEVVGA